MCCKAVDKSRKCLHTSWLSKQGKDRPVQSYAVSSNDWMQSMKWAFVLCTPLSLLVSPCGFLTCGMLQMVESGTFGEFWDTIGLIVNGNIFFFSGASAINFFWRSTEASFEPDSSQSPLEP